jgi:hypothetical protein
MSATREHEQGKMGRKRYIRPDSSAHWYTGDGEPRHDANLRTARKELLYPSVTTVLSAKSAPGLEAWKRNELLLAALDLPEDIREADDVDVAAKYIMQQSTKKVETAVARGTFVHDSIEAMFNGKSWDEENTQLQAVAEWIEAKCVDHKWSEESLVNKEVGYAGRADTLMDHEEYGLTLVDFKTQDVKKSRKGKWTPRYYDKFVFQLRAYSQCLPVQPRLLSLVINNNADEVYERLWTEDEADQAWAAFKHIHAIWCYDKKFFPAKHEEEVAA